MARRTSWYFQLVRIQQRGYDARIAGQSEDDNPYGPSRSNLQRQRRNYWLIGWKHADQEAYAEDDCPNCGDNDCPNCGTVSPTF